MSVFSRSPLVVLVPLFFVIAYLVPLNATWLWQPDETRYAEISREMLETGDWVVPRLLGVRYFEKPVAGYWLNNISQFLFGENSFSVRFGSAFCTGISALLVFWMGLRIWREQHRAFVAVLMYLSLSLVYGIGTYSVLDPILAMWLTAAMSCSYLALFGETRTGRMRAYALLGLVCGMGVMTKGLLALVVPVLGTLPAAVRMGRLKELFTLGFFAPLTAVLICLPWAVALNIREPDFWQYFFWVEHVQRFSSENAQHIEPFWYYLPVLVLGVFPWLGFLPGAILRGWKERAEHPELFFVFCWAVMPFLFFSIAKGKLLTYILPCMAPLALMMAQYAIHSLDKVSLPVLRNPLRINSIINFLFGCLCVVVLLVVVLGIFPVHLFPGKGHERELWFGIFVLLCWIGISGLGWRWPTKYWLWAALFPVLLVTTYIAVLPDTLLAQNKQPQAFIREHLAALQQTRVMLANDPGVATALAWELKRSNIVLYSGRGELEYGIIRSAEPGKHAVAREAFPAWLERERTMGKVGLLLRTSKSEEELLKTLPKPDVSFRTGKHVLFLYNQR